MNLDNIHRLIDILNDAPGIAELSVTAPDGAQVSLRRAPAAHAPMELALRPAQPLERNEQEVVLPEPEARPHLATIEATMVGLFHSANPPLGYGASVSVGQIVGYIESMKLMNEVTSSSAGTVAEVLIDENMPVEYG